MTFSTHLSDRKVNGIVVALLSLYLLAGMGVDLISPSLPAIAERLHTSHSFSQNLVSIYLLGYVLVNLFIGFLSDAWGRRKLLIASLLIYGVGSVLPIIFPHESTLLLARFLQGLGMGAMPTLIRTILSDLLPRPKLISASAMIGTLWGLGSIAAPIIGGYLQYYFNWTAGFYFFTAFALIAFLAIASVVPETLPARQPLKGKQIRANFKRVSSHSTFMGLIILSGLSYSVMIVFAVLGPFFIQKNLGYTSIFFGHLGLALGILFLLGTVICRYVLRIWKPETLIFYTLAFSFVIGLVQLILAYIYGSSAWVIIIPAGILFFIIGLSSPASTVTIMRVFQEEPYLSGTANSMFTLVPVLITVLVSLIVSFVHQTNGISISWACLGLILLAGLAYYGLVANRPSQAAGEPETGSPP